MKIIRYREGVKYTTRKTIVEISQGFAGHTVVGDKHTYTMTSISMGNRSRRENYRVELTSEELRILCHYFEQYEGR